MHTGSAKRRRPRPAWLALLVAQSLATATAQLAYVNFEGKQTNPVRLSPDGSRLFAVNTPDARVSVFDVTNPANPVLIAEIPVGIEPVSVNPRSNDEAWVVNEVSDSVSVVSVPRGIVTDTLQVKDEPADVVFAAGRAFVSSGRRNELHIFDAESRARLAVLPVQGHNPRALAVSRDGSKVYAAFALSGNRTTLVPPQAAPPQPMPTQITNPPPRVGLIVDATDPEWSHVIKYSMPDHDVVEVDVATLTVSRYFPRVGTVNLGLAVHPTSGDLFVANTDARNLVRFEKNVRGYVVLNRISRVALSAGTVTAHDLNPGVDYGVLPNPDALATALAQPTAIAFDPSGDFMYVAAFGTDRIARVGVDGTVEARIEVNPSAETTPSSRTKRGPRGLALSADGAYLYVLNQIANTLTVIQTGSETVVRELSVGSFDPTPTTIRAGRGFLYDARLSGNGTAACASCHVDAEMDFLAWDLGDPDGRMETTRVNVPPFSVETRPRHPMKGPMTTQTLRGLLGQDPLHWRGDRTNFLHFNGAFSSLLGGTPLSANDMGLYRTFINSIRHQPNPNLNLDGTLATQVEGGNPAAGRTFYHNTPVMRAPEGIISTCAGCHDLVVEGVTPLIIRAEELLQAQAMKVPQLRNIYQKASFSTAPGATNHLGFGLTHNGQDGGLLEHFSIARFLPILRNDPVTQRDLAAFILSFDTGTAPAVGHSLTLQAGNVGDAAVVETWSVLERQPAASARLIVKGTLGGVPHGLLFNPATGRYESDQSGLGPLTREQLVKHVLTGDRLTLMGVPDGSQRRMGLDRNANGLMDGDEPAPALSVERSAAGLTISWPAAALGTVLEFSETLQPPQWKTDTSARNQDGERISLATSAADSARFYRLRRF